MPPTRNAGDAAGARARKLPGIPLAVAQCRDGLPAVDIGWTLKSLVSIAVAFLLALPLGWEREQSEQSAGLRTFPLVAMASCGYILIATKVLGDHPEGQARVIEGLMTGIGFIGGGAILKSDGAVRGTATAASIWNTGAIGAAVAFERYEIALILAVINFAALRWLAPFKTEIPSQAHRDAPR